MGDQNCYDPLVLQQGSPSSSQECFLDMVIQGNATEYKPKHSRILRMLCLGAIGKTISSQAEKQQATNALMEVEQYENM